MKVIGNIKSGSFKSLLGKFTAPADQLSSKAASRFGEYTQAAFDERFPSLHEEDEGEGEEEAPEDAGGAYARTTRTVRSVLTPRELRRVEREQGLNLRRQAARGELNLDDDEDDDFMPPANRGEILDAAEGLVDILSGMPQTPTVRSLLANVGALVGDVAAEPTGPTPKKKLGVKVKEATAPVRAKAQARFQRLYDSAVNDVFGEDEDAQVGGSKTEPHAPVLFRNGSTQSLFAEMWAYLLRERDTTGVQQTLARTYVTEVMGPWMDQIRAAAPSWRKDPAASPEFQAAGRTIIQTFPKSHLAETMRESFQIQGFEGEEDEGVGQTVGPSIPYDPEAREWDDYEDPEGECEYDEDDEDDGSSGLIVVGDLADEESGYAGEEEDFRALRDVTKRIHRGYHSED